MTFFPYLWIALGSALGGILRFVAYGMTARLFGDGFPWGTLAVNIAGSALIGLFAGLGESDGAWHASPAVRHFVMPGLCGGFTTFSTFSLDTLHLARSGDMNKALVNIAASLIFCLLGVWLGHAIANQWTRA